MEKRRGPLRRTITIALENHHVVSCLVSEEDGWAREMEAGKTAAYLLTQTDLMELALSHGGPVADEVVKEQVLAREKEFQYRMTVRTAAEEIAGQMTAWMALKLFVVSPMISVLDLLASGDCRRSFLVAFFKRFIDPSLRHALMVFVYGRANARNLEALLGEVRQRYFGSQQ